MPNSKISRTRWTTQERQRLLDTRAAFPKMSWKEIQHIFFPDRTEIALSKEYSLSKTMPTKEADLTPSSSNKTSLSRTTKRGRGPKEYKSARPEKQTKSSRNIDKSALQPELYDGDGRFHTLDHDSPTSDETDWEGRDIDHITGMAPSKTPDNPSVPVTESAGPSTRASQKLAVSQKSKDLATTTPVALQKSPSPSSSPNHDSSTNPQDPMHKPSSPKLPMVPPPSSPSPPAAAASSPPILPAFGEHEVSDEIISLFLMRASEAVKEYPKEHARANQLEEKVISFQKEIKQLKDMLAEKEDKNIDQEKEMERLRDSGQKQKEDLEKQRIQIEGLEAELQQLRENHILGGLNEAQCQDCAENKQKSENLAEANKSLHRRLTFFEDAYKQSRE